MDTAGVLHDADFARRAGGAIVPLAIITLTRALRGRFTAHRRIALWTWPIWIYVSVTGVLVYVMVYQIYGPPLLPSSAASQAIETSHR